MHFTLNAIIFFSAVTYWNQIWSKQITYLQESKFYCKFVYIGLRFSGLTAA